MQHHRLLLAAVAVSVLGPSALAQPIPHYANRAVDAASNSDGLTPGGLFVVQGYFPARIVWASLPLPKTLDGYSVTLTPGTGPPIEAWMVYTHYQQMAAVLPSSTPPGIYKATVRTPKETWDALKPVRVLRRKYRAFTNNQEGWGLAVVQNYVSAARVDRNMFAVGRLPDGQTKAPALPGQTVVLWGTGLGAIDWPDNMPPDGALDLRGQFDLRVAVGGTEAVVTYAGRSPQFPGIDQINFVVPNDTITGCNIALEVAVDRAPSNPVTLAIAPPGATACEHPVLSHDSLELLDQGRPFTPAEFDRRVAGDFMLRTHVGVTSHQGKPAYMDVQNIAGSFRVFDAGEVSRTSFRSIAPGRCVTWRGDPETHTLLLGTSIDDSADAGTVTLAGPSRPELPLDGDDDYYLRLLSVRLEDGTVLLEKNDHPLVPGEYTLRATGGTDIGAFTASVAFPVPLAWPARDTLTEIDAAAGLPLSWTGGSATDRVAIQGGVVTYGTPPDPSIEVTAFNCVATPGTTAFSVPASALSGMAAGRNGLLEIRSWGPGRTAPFRVPMAGSDKTVPATFGYEMVRTIQPAYR